MLRAALIVLLVANALALAWGRGWLAPLLPPPGAGEREPERLLQQVRPESITVLSPNATQDVAGDAAGAAAAAGSAASPTPLSPR